MIDVHDSSTFQAARFTQQARCAGTCSSQPLVSLLHDSADKARSAADYRQIGGNAKGGNDCQDDEQFVPEHPVTAVSHSSQLHEEPAFIIVTGSPAAVTYPVRSTRGRRTVCSTPAHNSLRNRTN